MSPPQVLLVEDEADVARPLATRLHREGFEVTVEGTAAGAVSAFEARAPDVVLLDLRLPDGSGLDVCRAIRSSSGVPIIILSAAGEETDRIVGLDLGADDYVVKPFSAREMVARLRSVLRRGPLRGLPGPVTVGQIRLDPRARTVTIGGRPVDLRAKEFDLLHLLMAHAGQVLTREHIMEQVWDPNWFGPTKTLDVHVRALRRKLGDDPSRPRYLHTVRRVGFRFAGPEDVAGPA